MADELNIITSDANAVNVNTEDRTVTITNDSDATTITLSAAETTTIQIATIGPQGPKGDVGNIDTATLATTGSNIFIGTQTITGSINVTNGITGSLLGSASFAATASYALNAGAGAGFPFSGSAVITGSLLVTDGITGSFSGPLKGTADTASYYLETDPIYTAEKGKYLTTGSVNTSQTIVGSLIIDQNLTVLGSHSIQYITSSQLNIQTNLITVNTATPAIRFGGLAVIDSGSLGTGLTGSLLWDSENNVWIYSNPSGAAYDGGMLLTGPRNINGIGNEVGINNWYAAIGNGSHHMTSSVIWNSGSLIRLETNTQITGGLSVSQGITGSFSGSVFGYVPNTATSSFLTNSQTSSFVLNSQTASFATTGSNIFRGNQTITGSLTVSGSTVMTGSVNINGTTGTTLFSTNADTLVITGSLIVTGSTIMTGSLNVSSGVTASLQGTASWASNATTASYVLQAVSASYVLNAVSSSFATSASFAVSSSRAVSSSFATTAVTSSYPIAVTGSTIYSTGPAAGPNFSTNNSIFLGDGAGDGATNAIFSNFIGGGAGIGATSASLSNFMGYGTAINAINASGSNFLGYFAGNLATDANNSNFFGQYAGYGAIKSSYSTLIGFQAGAAFSSNAIGTNNIIIGTNISLQPNRRDSINIGGIIFGTGSYANTTGEVFTGSLNGKIGVNVVTPTRNFEVSGSVAFPNLTNTPQANYVSIDTATGQLYYQPTLSTASVDEINTGTSTNIVGPDNLEQSKFSTINIFNHINFT